MKQKKKDPKGSSANDDARRAQVLAEEDTGELPVLDMAGMAGSDAPPAGPKPGDWAATWLTHMDAEIAHLQAKWRTIEGELKLREGRIRSLEQELEHEDDRKNALSAELDRVRGERQEFAHRLLERDETLRELTAGDTARASKLEGLAAEMESLTARNEDLQAQLDVSLRENDRLHGLIEHERAGAQSLSTNMDDLAKSNDQLRVELQELEAYIDGRKGSWTQMTDRLKRYEETLAGMEQVIKGTDARIAQKEKEKEALASHVLDLERKTAELAGRRDEREAACQELQVRLDAQIKANEQVRAELSLRQKETQEALDKSISQDKLVASLERGVERRDETIAELEASLSEQHESNEKLTTQNTKLTSRAAQLEDALEDKVQTIQGLRSELKVAHQRADEHEAEAATSIAKQAELQGSWLDHEHKIDELTAELGALREERTRLAGSLSGAEQRVTELEAELHTATGNTDSLQGEIVALQELVARLEADLEAKHLMMSALDRSAERLNELSMSLHSIDTSDSGEYIGTVALDDDGGDCLDIGHPHEDDSALTRVDALAPSGSAQRMFIAIDHEDGRRYPLLKPDATIGRSRTSDIRIQSVFVSRIHARLHAEDSRIVIEDAGSKNGILVNSEPVGRRVLHNGDIVSLGGKLDLKYVETQ